MHNQAKIYYAIGTMSGTSMDGIDVALISTDGEQQVTLIDTASYSYQPMEHFYLKAAEFAIRQEAKITHHNRELLLAAVEQNFIHYYQQYCQQTQQSFPSKNWQQIVELSTQLHAKLIKQLIQKYPTECKQAIIGYHGQTVYHQPQFKITVQIGNPQQLSQLTNLPVVFDFRQQDVELGGQGAPLAPVFHQALVLRDQLPLPSAIINCGGIANVSLVKGEKPEDVIGFDIGPGNVLLDNFVRLKTHYQEHYDRDGQYANKGKILLGWIEKLTQDACRIKDYYDLPPAKSLDTADFQLPVGFDTVTLEDGCATLAYFTAERIAHSLLKQEKQWLPKLIILVGGGWYNPYITAALRDLLPETMKIVQAKELQWDNQSIEAQIFAYLAIRHINQLPFSFPLTTGVSKPVCGGVYITCQ